MEAVEAGSDAAAVLGEGSLTLCLRVVPLEAGPSWGLSLVRACSSLLPLGALACDALPPAAFGRDDNCFPKHVGKQC